MTPPPLYLITLALTALTGCARTALPVRPTVGAVDLEVSGGRSVAPPEEDEPPPPRVVLAPLDELPDPAVVGTTLEALAGALEGIVPRSEEHAGSVTVERALVWRPEHGRELIVWAGCRGEEGSDTRICALAVGRVDRGGARDGAVAVVRVLIGEPTGWRSPDVYPGDSRGELVLQGEDGQGSWYRSLTFSRGGVSGLHLGEPTHHSECGQ